MGSARGESSQVGSEFLGDLGGNGDRLHGRSGSHFAADTGHLTCGNLSLLVREMKFVGQALRTNLGKLYGDLEDFLAPCR